jgi:hypothetical protein
VRILLYYAIQAVTLAILVLQFKVQTERQYDDESCKSTTDCAATNVEGPANVVSD